jgi:hypothetical protein
MVGWNHYVVDSILHTLLPLPRAPKLVMDVQKRYAMVRYVEEGRVEDMIR